MRSRQQRRRHVGTAILTAALAAALAACGTSEKRSTPPTTAAATPESEYESTVIPDSPVGGQLRWFLEAVKALPIPVPAIDERFAASFLAQLPPDQINLVLTESGAATMRFLGVRKMTPTSIEVAVDPGSGRPRQIVSMVVDGDGRIAGLLLKPYPLESRAVLGLAPVALPEPTGPSPVGTEAVVATDAARDGRRIPVQLWYPAVTPGRGSPAEPARYAQAGTSSFLAEILAVPIEDVAAIATNATSDATPATGGGRLPVVLFSPGLGVTRTFYSGLGAELASHGYLVAVVDHPGDGQLVEFPDGPPVAATPPADDEDEDAMLDEQLATRVADADAVLDLLERLDADPAARLHRALDLSRIAFAGHSYGGATAAEAMRLDGRFRAGINLDGTLYGEVIETGLDRPFLLVSSARPEEPEEDDTWVPFRMRTAEALSLVVDGSGHMSFSDWPALSALRPAGEPREPLGIGTIDPARSIAVQSAYVLAFLDHHLLGEQEPLLDGPSPQYPEVRFR